MPPSVRSEGKDLKRGTPDGRISYPYHSPQLELRHGFDSAAVARDASLIQDAVHPEDRPAWLAAIEDSAERLTPFGGDYRIMMRGGGFHWFRTIATPTREADGTVVWDGISIDISEHGWVGAKPLAPSPD